MERDAQGVSGKFDRLIIGAPGRDLPDDVQDDVLGVHPPGDGPLDFNPDGRGHLEPEEAVVDGQGEVRRSDPGRQGVQGAVGGGVGIRADHQVAGADVPLLRDELVANPLPLGVERAADPARERLDIGVDPGDLLARAGAVVVQDHHQLPGIPDRVPPDLLQRLQNQGEGGIVGHHHVGGSEHHLPGADLLLDMGAENLLGDGLTHDGPSPRFSL